ncbi:hypothetical protein [Chryseobacterium sp. ERMR1:04]|uniref:hypothetical protein n=1 Tax=Chryseobacterium sp. ERMR1:04 TaxID=1705393 RepID=UPI0006C8C7EF|nr:hypothetical protein [Chryseobacterium sp. ERMR1:04]KPH13511.1 hypothetical protein AMQ68_07990 [Chryseobacterium sp. ERMR1:04]
MRKSKKIYYFLGLISALLIPILFWYYAGPRAHQPYTVLDLGIPSKHKYNDTIDNTFESVRNWKYQKIIVKPNTALQNQQYYISELKKLQQRNEKETGIEFIIDDKNNYQDLVTLINTMQLAKQETYGVDVGNTGHFFAVHFYQDPNKNYAICGGVVGGPTDYKQKEGLSFADIKGLPRQSYYIIFGFLLFLNISMLSIKERFQINRKTII